MSSAASSVTHFPRTIQLQGLLAGKSVIILVDSGSTHSFISSSVAAQLDGIQDLAHPISVRLAVGGTISCSASIPSVEWYTHGLSFHSHLKILPLGSFDLILGMDWLEAFSPMKIHWQQKLLSSLTGLSLLSFRAFCLVAQILINCFILLRMSSTVSRQFYCLRFKLFWINSAICLLNRQIFHPGVIVTILSL